MAGVYNKWLVIIRICLLLRRFVSYCGDYAVSVCGTTSSWSDLDGQFVMGLNNRSASCGIVVIGDIPTYNLQQGWLLCVSTYKFYWLHHHHKYTILTSLRIQDEKEITVVAWGPMKHIFPRLFFQFDLNIKI